MTFHGICTKTFPVMQGKVMHTYAAVFNLFQKVVDITPKVEFPVYTLVKIYNRDKFHHNSI